MNSNRHMEEEEIRMPGIHGRLLADSENVAGSFSMASGEIIRGIFEKYKTIAVYGMSKDPNKPAHQVPVHLRSEGYNIIPINPTAPEISGLKSYARLEDVPEHIEVLDVFRPSEQAAAVVREAIARKEKFGDICVIWLQENIKSEEARRLAEGAGIVFIEDLCLSKEFRRLYPK